MTGCPYFKIHFILCFLLAPISTNPLLIGKSLDTNDVISEPPQITTQVGQKQCRYEYDISGLAAHVLPADVLTPAPCSVANYGERKRGSQGGNDRCIIRHESLTSFHYIERQRLTWLTVNTIMCSLLRTHLASCETFVSNSSGESKNSFFSSSVRAVHAITTQNDRLRGCG